MIRPDRSLPAEPGRRRPWLTDDDLLPALVFIVLAGLALLTPVQNDTFWHLRSGQEIWRTLHFLESETFSYTSVGFELNDHWWLSQLAFFGFYALGGPFLLTVFAGACSLSSVVMSWRLVRGSWEVRVVLLVILALMAVPGWGLRPQALSLVFVALMAQLIARGRFGWLPLVCVAWSNVHALVVLGVAVAGSLVIEAVLWSRHELRRSIVIAMLCAAAPMVSPVGLDFWPQALTSVALSKDLYLAEYRFPFEPGDLPFWAAVAALGVLTLMRRATLASASRPERTLLVASVILACAAATAARNVPVFVLVAVPVISWLWTPLPGPASGRIRPAPVSSYLFLGAALLVTGAVVFQHWRHGEWQTTRAAGSWRPLSGSLVQAVRACPEPIFNRLDDGGYLMWMLPERKVFVDSRINAYSADLLRQSRAADVYGDYAEPFSRYGINCAVVGTASPMYQRLQADTSFEITYTDPDRSVFVRRAPAGP
jgi:hypothetical protein